ncbi:hypothetical protein ACGGZK_02265 [Agromyces sp. MMS24-K17]|uniref:hypothetical protein n=1 Tax=Agromyces sp. MMS24-K17 TaxID=3372850 RepID=UPI003754ABFC
MSASRIATVVLALVGLGAFALLQSEIHAINTFNGISWDTSGPTADQIAAMARNDLGYMVILPGLATLTVASGFALAVVAARAIARRWMERDLDPDEVEPPVVEPVETTAAAG